MSLLEDVKQKLSQLNVFEKLIAANVVIFLIASLLKIVLSTGSSLIWFELPSDFIDFIKQPWAIITYAFVHYDFMHLLFNMIWLYVIGQLFINLFNFKLGLNVYFLGAISGGLVFLLGYNVFPGLFDSGHRLVGASAAVRALLIFLCAYMPNKEMRFFTFNIKLWYVGIAVVIMDFVGLFGLNAGGNLAHFGGTILGYFYGTQLSKGNDIGKGFENLMDIVISWFKPGKRSPLKTVHKKKKSKGYGGYTKKEFNEFNNQKRIDIILDKISKSGYDSLSKEEKEFLFKAGK